MFFLVLAVLIIARHIFAKRFPAAINVRGVYSIETGHILYAQMPLPRWASLMAIMLGLVIQTLNR